MTRHPPDAAAHTTVAGVILAGGRSRRMGGGDKALSDLAGEPLIDRVVSRLAPQVPVLAVNANGDPSRFAHLRLPVLRDTLDGHQGPLAGVLAGLRWAQLLSRSLVVTVPADTPFVPKNLVTQLMARIESADVAVASSRGVDHPTVALWRAAQADDLEAWLRDADRRAVRAWIATRSSAMVAFGDGDGGDPFFNVNTPADLEEASARARGEKA